MVFGMENVFFFKFVTFQTILKEIASTFFSNDKVKFGIGMRLVQ